jgi:hypothetical protein
MSNLLVCVGTLEEETIGDYQRFREIVQCSIFSSIKDMSIEDEELHPIANKKLKKKPTVIH